MLDMHNNTYENESIIFTASLFGITFCCAILVVMLTLLLCLKVHTFMEISLNVIKLSIVAGIVFINNYITISIITMSNQLNIVINNTDAAIDFIGMNEKIHYVSGFFCFLDTIQRIFSVNIIITEFYSGVCLCFCFGNYFII